MDIELSKQAFHLAWQHFRLGSKPLALNVLPEGVTASERGESEERAWEELRRLGFGDRDREDDISAVFLPLHCYQRAFDIVYRYVEDGEQHRMSGLAASGSMTAALAVQGAETVRLMQLRAEELHRAVVSVLPEPQAGPGKAVSLRSEHLDAAAAEAGESNRAMRESLIRQGVRRDDADALVEMAGHERIGYAQFGASVMDRRGNRTRAPMVTNCFATPRGWYLMEETRRTGEAWTTFAPIDQPRMARRVQDLLDTITTD